MPNWAEWLYERVKKKRGEINASEALFLFCFLLEDSHLKIYLEYLRAKGNIDHKYNAENSLEILSQIISKENIGQVYKEPQPEQAAPEPQQMELKDLLPKKLKADEAVEVFQNAIDAQLITNSPEGLKWNDTKQLLAYFATKVSDKFNLTTKLDKDGNKTTDWKTFEILFNKRGLNCAKQNWMKQNTKFVPGGRPYNCQHYLLHQRGANK